MKVRDALGYAADIAIIATYAALAAGGNAIWFHAANAVGCIPLLYVEWKQGAYPVMPLTGLFGVLGWYAVLS